MKCRSLIDNPSKRLAGSYPGLAVRFQLQIRGESFNILNRPNYANPNTQYGNTAFGTITSTETRNQQNQIGLKLLF